MKYLLNLGPPRTHHRSLVDDLDVSGKDLYGLPHVTRWEPCDLRYLVRVSWVGSALMHHSI